MNRLQKKCIIVSAGIHLLLVILLVVGPGFISTHSKEDSPPLITFIPVSTTDALVSGGGDNTVKAPPAQATTPEPPAPQTAAVTPPVQVTPPAQVTPPVVERVVPPKVEKSPTPAPKDPPRVEKIAKTDVSVKPQKHEIKIDTTLKTTSSTELKAIRDAQAKAAAAEQKRIAAAIGRARSGIRGGVSGSTELRLAGPGGGGVPYANFRSAVQKVYWDAWSVPNGVPNLTVTASVTIARDGTVISSRINDGSGNTEVDASVQRALERVKFAAPLPDSATEDKREVFINFNTQAKLEA